jgi:hypothetical protein
VGYSKQVKILYASIVSLVFIIGFFNNFCSFMTFKRHTPRKFGVGNYLFILSVLNQVALLCLLLKFVLITFEIRDLTSCKGVSYFLSVFTRSTYWLTSWISVDRLLMILIPTSSVPKDHRLAILVTAITVIVLFSIHVHEVLYYTIIQHHLIVSSICVTNFDNRLISIYNRASTLIHYLCPFLIQVICITSLIILATRSRVKTIGQRMSLSQMLKKQFQNQKELYVTPTIIILSALPQTILTSSFACTQMTDLQRHMLLSAYMLSYAPQVLGFIIFVIPSTHYKKEFGETVIAKKCFKWMLDKETSELVISKTKETNIVLRKL